MSDSILKPTFTLKAGGNEFVFRVPTPLDKVRQGAREAAIRRFVDPTGGGWPDGLDVETFYTIRGMAVLELFLDKTDARWVYSEAKDAAKGAVLVDIATLPPGKEDVIAEVGRGFQAGLDKFHGRGAEHTDPDISKNVAGGLDTGTLRPLAPADTE